MTRIAFLRRKKDGTWDTKTEEVPDSTIKGADAHEAARQWGRKNLLKLPEYKDVIYLGIYSMNPKENS